MGVRNLLFADSGIRTGGTEVNHDYTEITR